MGGGKSKPAAPSPFFSTPWRDINWGNNQTVLQYVKNYKPETNGQKLRILLHGPVGAGKSSFINSVRSTLQGKISSKAGVDNSMSDDSFTKKYQTYTVPKSKFVFNDIMGLEIKGVLVDDIKLALKGHVKDGYTFNPVSKMSEKDQYYNKNPTNNDKVHVLVCVVPASTVSSIKDEVVRKMREIRMEASDLGIPQVAIITKIDEVCPEIKQDLKNVYRLKVVKTKMEEFSVKVGIPMNCIFPVKNYHEENNLNSDTDSLILDSLKTIINFGEEFLDDLIMGGEESKPAATSSPSSRPPPPPSPFFDTPWRDINWGNNQTVLQYVKNYKPETNGQKLRILLHGPVGAGKSSFINSVRSTLQGTISSKAGVDNSMSDDSFTKKYQTYKVPKSKFVFNDIMGLEIKGVLVDDIKLALKGHVKDGYTFNPVSKMSEKDQYYNKDPTNNDKVHVLVCVVPASTVSSIKDEVVRKMREIRMEASDLGIPQVAIITKIDEVCPEIKQDLKNVYRLKVVKTKMEEFSVKVGIPMNCIFPVKNYHEEMDLNSHIDSLILKSLKTIIDFGEEFLDDLSQSDSDSD